MCEQQALDEVAKSGGEPMTHFDVDDLYRMATGFSPYAYQAAICKDGLPEILNAQTGTGKTEAVVLGWIWRRYFHPDHAVRQATPRWLVYALPMRTLVEQTVARVQQMLDRLHSAALDVAALPTHVYNVMGGERVGDTGRWEDRDWRLQPTADAIFVGTIDMLLSRALNRGYGDRRYNWPISFGMFNNGVQWVFDETQLMGVAVPTSRQLQAFRETSRLGTLLPTATTWMSATISADVLDTVDNPFDPASVARIDLAAEDEQLAMRLGASKVVEEFVTDPKGRAVSIASELVERHELGTLTIGICNTVADAVALYKAVGKACKGREADEIPAVELLHSRFRPPDRSERTRAVLDVANSPQGGIVISTQVLEAGIDLSAKLLYTDAAPWSSVVQRAGRCNRTGGIDDAVLLWSEPPKHLPYEEFDVKAAVEALRELEGRSADPITLTQIQVDTQPNEMLVLRRKDLIGLFDAAPDLSGNDLDVARFIREIDDRTVSIAWREFDDLAEIDAPPSASELCAVPIAEALKFLGAHDAWTLDPLAESRGVHWVEADRTHLRDGVHLLVQSEAGGYTAELGWDRSAKSAVPAIQVSTAAATAFAQDLINDGDPHSASERALTLNEHLIDVEREARHMIDALGLEDSPFADAARHAGLLHDIGKAHPVFQQAMHQVNGSLGSGLWAKSGSRSRLRYTVPYFRHELVSMLALFGEARYLADSHDEPALIRYLVASHHGRVRLSIRSLPNEEADVAWGVRSGCEVPEVDIDGTTVVPGHRVDLEPARFGSTEFKSYGEESLELVRRPDLGPFRLAALEAIVRLADWLASAKSEQSGAGE